MLCEKFDENSWKKLIKINTISPKNISYFYLQNQKTSSNEYYNLIIILTCDSVWKLISKWKKELNDIQ